VRPDLDHWLPKPAMAIAHHAASPAPPERLWAAAKSVRLDGVGLLGRLIRWRIPGIDATRSFDDLFRLPPFAVLEEGQWALASGIAGRIWTLRRDYAALGDPQAFLRWAEHGTAKVLFGMWVEPGVDGGSVLHSEARVDPIGAQGRIGVAAVRPLVTAFHPLIASEGIAAAVRLAGG
jgi:hypothetical protein